MLDFRRGVVGRPRHTRCSFIGLHDAFLLLFYCLFIVPNIHILVENQTISCVV